MRNRLSIVKLPDDLRVREAAREKSDLSHSLIKIRSRTDRRQGGIQQLKRLDWAGCRLKARYAPHLSGAIAADPEVTTRSTISDGLPEGEAGKTAEVRLVVNAVNRPAPVLPAKEFLIGSAPANALA
jgi:hypothetical protein